MGLKEIICLTLLVACVSASYYPSCPTLFNFYPDSNDCTKFYRCVWGRPVRFSCGVGTRWNQHLLTCDHAYNVPCGSYPANPPPTPYVPPQPVPNTYEPNYVHPVPNHNTQPDYYRYVDTYNQQYGNNHPQNGYGYHKK